MFCPECGKENPEHAAFCENCGTKLSEAVEEIQASFPEKKPHKKAGKRILVLSILAVVSIGVLCFTCYWQYSAGRIAEKYAEALARRDWNGVYDVLLLKDSGDFMSREAFVTAMNIDMAGRDSYPVMESIKKRSGGLVKKKYEIQWHAKEDGSDITQVILKRDGLFWKVEADEYLIQKYTFSVPKDTKVTVDKFEPAENLKTSEDSEEKDTYTISPVFAKTHYIELSGEGMDDTALLVTNTGEKAVFLQGAYNRQAKEKVTDQAVEDFKTILESASQNKRFSEVECLSNMYPSQKEGAISKYEYLRDTIFGSGNPDYQLVEYQISNIEANVSVSHDNVGYEDDYDGYDGDDYDEDDYDDYGDSGYDRYGRGYQQGNDIMTIILKGNSYYKEETISHYFWGDEDETSYDSGEGVCSHTLYYINQDNQWKLYDMEINIDGTLYS